MAENLFGEITQRLGIKFQEIFKIKNSYTNENLEDFEFFFGPLGLYSKELNKNDEGAEWFRDDISLRNIITGFYEIVKLPFVPKINETYYTYTNGWAPTIVLWKGDAFDYINKACDMVFRTEKELIDMRPKQYLKLTGEEWKDTNND